MTLRVVQRECLRRAAESARRDPQKQKGYGMVHARPRGCRMRQPRPIVKAGRNVDPVAPVEKLTPLGLV